MYDLTEGQKAVALAMINGFLEEELYVVPMKNIHTGKIEPIIVSGEFFLGKLFTPGEDMPEEDYELLPLDEDDSDGLNVEFVTEEKPAEPSFYEKFRQLFS